jgi:hypothetical protein
MEEVAHLNSVEQHITASIINSVYFEWIKSTGSSLHRQRIAVLREVSQEFLFLGGVSERVG